MTGPSAPTARPAQKPRNSFPAWYLRRGTINAPDDAIERASSSCERWEWGFAGLVVFAVAAELVLAIVHPPYDSWWNRWGSAVADALIALGIIGEVLFGRMDGRYQTELRKRSNDRLAQVEFDNGFLQESAARANERAAEALQKAADADLARVKIEERLAHRTLSNEQFEIVVGRIKEFSGTPVSVVIRAPESIEITLAANLLIHVVSTAGWRVVTGVRIDRGPLVVGVPIGAIGAQPAKAGRALAEALREAGIAARFDRGIVNLMSRFIGTGDPPIVLPRGDDPSVVTVVVGIKPEEWKAATADAETNTIAAIVKGYKRHTGQ
jgi:hypothetical protein